MEQKTLSAEPSRSFSNEFKLQMVKLASQQELLLSVLFENTGIPYFLSYIIQSCFIK